MPCLDYDRDSDNANNEKNMKNLLILFTALFIMCYIGTIANAKLKPPFDDIDELLNKVSKNIEISGEVTKMAQNMNEEMVASKVAEKAKLQNEVASSHEQIGRYKNAMLVYNLDTIHNNLEIDSVNINNFE